MSSLLRSVQPSRTATPIVLVVTPCVWTARALDAGLAAAGMSVVRTSDPRHAARAWAGDVAHAALVDERMSADPAGRGLQRCRELAAARAGKPPRPLLVLTRAHVTPGERRALIAAGAWAVAPYPLGSREWVRRLEGWVAAGYDARP